MSIFVTSLEADLKLASLQELLVELLLSYLASFAIWWVRRETFRLALFL
jgi:hypothetical protein